MLYTYLGHWCSRNQQVIVVYVEGCIGLVEGHPQFFWRILWGFNRDELDNRTYMLWCIHTYMYLLYVSLSLSLSLSFSLSLFLSLSFSLSLLFSLSLSLSLSVCAQSDYMKPKRELVILSRGACRFCQLILVVCWASVVMHSVQTAVGSRLNRLRRYHSLLRV